MSTHARVRLSAIVVAATAVVTSLATAIPAAAEQTTEALGNDVTGTLTQSFCPTDVALTGVRADLIYPSFSPSGILGTISGLCADASTTTTVGTSTTDGQPPVDTACDAGQVVVGIDGREGDLVDAIEMICQSLDSTGAPTGDLTRSTRIGGTGGGESADILCPTGEIVTGLWASAEPQFGILEYVALECSAPVIHAVPPTADAGADASGAEGSAMDLAGTVSDGATAAWSVTPGPDVDAGGTCTFGSPDATSTTITCTDDGTYTATLTADNSVDTPATDTATVTVSNAAPTVDITSPTGNPVVPINAPVTVHAALADAGSNDTLGCVIDWGDGPTDGAISAGECTGSHTYGAGAHLVTVTVTDDDGSQASDSQAITGEDLPAISIGDVDTNEGGGSLQFPLTLSAVSGHDVSVHWQTTATGTATAGADYTASSGTATINAGATSTSVAVPILDDDIDEPKQTVVVTLDSPIGAAVGDGSGTGTITDNDGTPVATVDAKTVKESVGTAQYTVRLSRATENSVLLPVSTKAGTAGTHDYTTTSVKIPFPAGTTTKTFAVAITDDFDVIEGAETFRILIGGPVAGVVIGEPTDQTITDNERHAMGSHPDAAFKLVRNGVVDRSGHLGEATTITVIQRDFRADITKRVEPSAFHAPDGSACDSTADRIAGCFVKIGVSSGGTAGPATDADQVVSNQRPRVSVKVTRTSGWVTTMEGECHSAVPIDEQDTTTCRLTDRAYDRATPTGTPFAAVRSTVHSDAPIPDPLPAQFPGRGPSMPGTSGQTMYDTGLADRAAPGGAPGTCTA